MSLSNTLQLLLHEEGADLVGIANLENIAKDELTVGVAVAVSIPYYVVEGIHGGPTNDYYRAYHEINARLDHMVTLGAKFLQALGYQAVAQTTTEVVASDNWCTDMPHKTVATNAGLGWIGKNALLVTREYGSAVRLSSILTNAPIECGKPYQTSLCGDCIECASHCPGGAIRGVNWDVGRQRDDLFDPVKCRRAARGLAMEKIQQEITLCGKCIVSCPFTKRYMKSCSTEKAMI